ncbi:TPA: hypothetical protein HA246_02810 [Candidatus Woesearchaeota archaeon]|nr:hypothetical protein [Candidatus Woesearchaeota archaeon]
MDLLNSLRSWYWGFRRSVRIGMPVRSSDVDSSLDDRIEIGIEAADLGIVLFENLPDSTEIYFNEAGEPIEYSLESKLRDALSLFDIAVKLNGDADCYYWRGVVRLELCDELDNQEEIDNYVQVIDDLTKSIELSHGTKTHSYYLRGFARINLADEAPIGYDVQALLREAIDDLTLYLTKEKKDYEAHNWLGQAYKRLIEFLPPSQERDEMKNRALFHKQKAYDGTKENYLLEQIEEIKELD